MEEITKKRIKAYFINFAITTAVTAGVEYLLRKKIKNEAFHALVTPTIVQYSLEFGQLRMRKKTVGYQLMGIELESVESETVTSKQIIKRLMYRDIVAGFDYMKDREHFERAEGAILSQDVYAGTIVREVD